MFNSKQTFNVNQIIKEQQNFIDCYSDGKKGILTKLLRFYKGHYKNLLISAIFYFLKASPTWIVPIITANIINIASNKPSDALTQFLINGIVILICVVQNPITYTIHISYFSRAKRSVEAGLRGAMVRKLQQLSIGFHKDFSSGKIHSKVMRDVEAIETFTEQIFNTALTMSTNMIISLSIVINKNITVFFMFLLCVPAAVFILRIFNKKIAAQARNFRLKMETTSSNVLEMEELVPVTRAHALEKLEVEKLTKSVTEIAKSGYAMDKVNALFGSVNWLVFLLFQLICLFFTGFLAFRGNIQVGDITLYQSYFTTLIGQVSSIVNLLPIISKGAESINSIGEILTSPNIEKNENKIKLKKLDGKYEFKDVSFNYDEETHVLDGLNLTVNPGETIALVGESGSGKSTILNLVIGFNKPTKGTVLIDGINIEEIDMRSCRKFISVVPQNSILFSGSIRDNITYGCPHVTNQMLDYAVKSACLDELIKSLPNGMDTLVGEHGAKLSGGQRQRISIARAIIRNPQVIVFDEATSALDSATEKEIQQAIENLTNDRTTFIVAHRLSTIRNADKIAVIDKGKCVEFGSYDELMSLKGKFYQLKKIQG